MLLEKGCKRQGGGGGPQEHKLEGRHVTGKATINCVSSVSQKSLWGGDGCNSHSVPVHGSHSYNAGKTCPTAQHPHSLPAQLTHHLTAYPPHDSLPTTWQLTHHMTAYPPRDSLPITTLQLTHHLTAYPPCGSLPTLWQLIYHVTVYLPCDSLPTTWQLTRHLTAYPLYHSLPITTWQLTHHMIAYWSYGSLSTMWQPAHRDSLPIK